MARMPAVRLRLSPEARRDIEDIVLWSTEHFGVLASERYEDLIIQALRDLEENPARSGTRMRPDLSPGLSTYHLLSSRDKVAGGRVKEPRHFIIFRQPSGGELDIIRVLHDSRDLARHLMR